MDVTPLIASDRKVIQSYGPEGFRISGKSYGTPVVVLPDRVLEWHVAGGGVFTEACFSFLAGLPPLDILLVGCGRNIMQLPQTLRSFIKLSGPVPDTMDTGAACRTYNVLLAEGRAVAAALLPPL